MQKKSWFLLSVLALFACATPAKYDAKLNGYVGENKAELIKEWGKPSAVKMIANGDEVLAYVKANDVYVPSEYYVYNQGSVANEDMIYSPFLGNYDYTPYAQAFGYQVEEICQTAFLVQSGIVTGWKWRGNNCVAY